MGPINYRRGTLAAGGTSMVFALVIGTHEVAMEGGFDLRNYVVVAFCFIWIIVTTLLLMGTHKKANFLLLPWMILTCMLTPLFVVGIVAGSKLLHSCIQKSVADGCAREFRIFGTIDYNTAVIKLTVLVVMFVANSGSILVVYKYFMVLTTTESRRQQGESITNEDDSIHKACSKYDRFRDDPDSDMHVPLCQNMEDSKETVT